MTVVFEWYRKDLETLLASVETDDVTPLVLEYFRPGSSVLESGCGAGRYVKYLADRGRNVVGIEISFETVSMVKRRWRELNIICGDVANPPFAEGVFDGVLSFGVVEHWPEGPTKPLQEIFRVLRSGGIAIITVPCLSVIRHFKRVLWYREIIAFFRAFIRLIVRRRGTPFIINRLRREYRYAVYPPIGQFRQYEMTPRQFSHEVRLAGFEVIHHVPSQNMYGLCRELNPFHLLARVHNWRVHTSRLAVWLDRLLRGIPFFHCHMQIVVSRKP